MRRAIISIAAAVSALVCANANAGVVWEGPYYTFRYGVEKNGGSFYYRLSTPPFLEYRESIVQLHYDPSSGQYAPYDGTAMGDLVEFNDPEGTVPGEIRVRAMAKGPEGGVSPPYGLLVQAFSEIVPTDMTSDHGVQITQQVGSWITRRFSVNRSGSYSILANLDGVVDYYDFSTGYSYFKAGHSLAGTVEVLENPDDPANIRTVAAFTLSVSNRNQDVEVTLQTGARYQLKVSLNIQSELENFSLLGLAIAGAVPMPHNYILGEDNSPLVLEAVVVDPTQDADGDSVPDALDICPFTYNPDQADFDGDKVGDACDNCPFAYNPDQADSDSDGIGNRCDLGLADAIMVLQVLAGMNPSGNQPADISGNGKLGLEEVIFSLQNAAGLR